MANLSWPIGASHGHLWPYVEPELLLMPVVFPPSEFQVIKLPTDKQLAKSDPEPNSEFACLQTGGLSHKYVVNLQSIT